MGILQRLFGKEPRQTPAAEGRAAAEPAPAAGLPDQPAAGEGRAAQAGAAEPAYPPAMESDGPKNEVPLRSLERYRQDPAFKNFMAKARKAPGSSPLRPGLPTDVFDRNRQQR
ncbi:MAG TPA: hypothetical protein VH916_03050 [Dehalococcoidia bacterium]